MAVFGLYQMILLICIILFVLLANLYLYHHFPKPKHPLQDISYDVAIVLGYPCNADGSLSTVQKKRMETAINLYHKHCVHHLLISGSCVQNTYIEAEKMAAYALTQKIPKQAIVLETKARNTYENLKYAKCNCDENQWENIIVITSPSHMRRAAFFVHKFFRNYVMDTYREHSSIRVRMDEYFRMWNTLYYERKLRKN